MSKIWVTSDLHLGHTNVIKYCNRPFKDVNEMDETIIMNWNSVVRPGDMVYVLGDVAFLKPEVALQKLNRLMGQIYLVKGNHDREHVLKACASRFVWIKDYFELKVDDQQIIMSHYPFLTWNKSHRGSWNLHGHSHGSLPDDPYARRIDVGVDCHNFFPISYDQIKELMSKKSFRAVDHHEEDR